MRDIAFVALGSNVGDREEHLSRARIALSALPESCIRAESRVEETAPIGPIDQPAFLNQMVALDTTLSPRDLLAHLLAIETSEGRTRDARWGPRTLDLDIVSYDAQTVTEPGLIVPHPELSNRDFWRRELAELRAALSAS